MMIDRCMWRNSTPRLHLLIRICTDSGCEEILHNIAFHSRKRRFDSSNGGSGKTSDCAPFLYPDPATSVVASFDLFCGDKDIF